MNKNYEENNKKNNKNPGMKIMEKMFWNKI